MRRAFCDVCGWAGLTAPSDPNDLQAGADALEVLVTRNQRCFPGLGKGGGEAVRVGQVVLRLETGVPPCGITEFHIDADNLNGKLGDLLQVGRRRFFPECARPSNKSRPS